MIMFSPSSKPLFPFPTFPPLSPSHSYLFSLSFSHLLSKFLVIQSLFLSFSFCLVNQLFYFPSISFSLSIHPPLQSPTRPIQPTYTPSYRWYREDEGGGRVGVGMGVRGRVVAGQLVMKGVSSRDSGHYLCVANNTAGTDSYRLVRRISVCIYK